jgi:hypothetical protein
MSRRPSSEPPSYRLHKQSGQAVVTLTDGAGRRRDTYLGRYGSAESRAEYARVIAEWEASGRRLTPPPKAQGKAAARADLSPALRQAAVRPHEGRGLRAAGLEGGPAGDDRPHHHAQGESDGPRDG